MFDFQIAFSQYEGGAGRGEVLVSRPLRDLYSSWSFWQNNRVMTNRVFIDASENQVFTASLGSLQYTLLGISANTLSSSSVSNITPPQPGIHHMYQEKRLNEPQRLLIRGDFRSIRIDPSIGQPQCSARSSYSLLLWLDNDNIIVGVTKCFTDKTLTLSAYNPPSTTAWFNIQNGKAIQINSSGVITAICN